MSQNNSKKIQKSASVLTDESRRKFISYSSMAISGAALSSQLSLAPAVFARDRSPNDTLGVALIGCGNRASALLNDLLSYRDSHNLRIPMICDVWERQLDEKASHIESETGERCETTTRYADVLASPEVDCVVVATPDFSHTPILVDAASAGKHAYVEKPVSVSLDQANRALEAVEESGIIFQAGTQFRASGPYRGAAHAMREDVIGDLLKVNCQYNRQQIGWLRDYEDIHPDEVDWQQFLMDKPAIPFDPVRFRRWQLYRDYTNGLLGLLGTHLFDIVAWLSGDPLPESAVGVENHLLRTEHEHADYQECIFAYPTGFAMNFTSHHGNADPATGSAFYGTEGTLHGTYSLSEDAEIVVSRSEGSDAPSGEEIARIEPIPGTSMIGNWIQCIRSSNKDTYADINAAYAHSVTAALGTEAIAAGRRVHYDDQNLAFNEI